VSHDKCIAFDFDGVLHQYSEEAAGTYVPTPTGVPVAGAIDTTRVLVAMGYKLVIFSCRATIFDGGKEAIEKWLEKYDFPAMEVVLEKPLAKLYIDDRGFRFEGPQSWLELMNFLQKYPIPPRWSSNECLD